MKLKRHQSLDGVEPCEGPEFGGQSKLEGYRHTWNSADTKMRFLSCVHWRIPPPPECQGDIGILQNLPTKNEWCVGFTLLQQEAALQLLAEPVKQTPTGLLTQPGGSARAGALSSEHLHAY